ncbi:MAG: tRNA dihydrouridine synthase, partial [Phycisphaerales bacterium]
MSCDGGNATPPSPGVGPGRELLDPAAYAAALGRRPEGPIDPRIRALVPAFDAPFFQAGLAGYSDAAMRIIARRHGCPFCVTEALLDRTLLAGGRGFVKADLGELHDNVPGGEEDHPLAGQIMGSDPREMAASAVKMIEQGRRTDKEYRLMAYEVQGVLPSTHASARQHLRLPGGQQVGFWPPESDLKHGITEPRLEPRVVGDPDQTSFEVIDVNLACPVKKIEKKARGGHWLAEPEGAIAILKAVREALPSRVVCTVKLRRSFDDTPEMAANFDRILSATADLGYAWATVHGRTVEQKYIGPSRWDILRDIVARHPKMIVFGSGDIWQASDIFAMLEYTGVSAVSVARGCIGNPWIFRQARAMLRGEPPSPPSLAEQRGVLEEHFRLLMAVCREMRHGEEQAGKLIRKFGIRFAEHHPRGEAVRLEMIRVKGLADWRAVLERWYGEAAAE